MMRPKLPCLWLLPALAILPAASQASGFDPAAEIASRSGLPTSEVGKLLANCDATQMSMNFCLWRDALVADHTLDKVASNAKTQSPACTPAIDTQISAWRKNRDALCTRDAASEYGEGSGATAEREQCVTSMTADYARHYESPRNCTAQTPKP